MVWSHDMMLLGWVLVCFLIGGMFAPAAAGADERQRFHVGDFGAVGDGRTDDGPAIREAISAAMAADGPATVLFDDAVYRLGEYEARWCALPLIGAHGVVLDGRGAKLVFHPNNRALLLYRCQGITVRGFRFDYDPLPFTQGDVVEVNRLEGTFDMRLHEGYPEPPSQAFMEANGNSWRHGAFLEPDRRIYTTRWVYVDAVHPVAEAGRTYRIQARENQWGVLDEVKPGQRFVLQLFRYDRAWQEAHDLRGSSPDDKGVFLSNRAASIQIRFSKCCLLEDIDHYISPGMTFRLTGTEDIHLRRIRITYKPGSDRLTAGLADGIHAKNSLTGPFVEGCLFEGVLDDSINLSTMMEIVEKQIEPTRFITRYSDIIWYDSSIKVGDELMAWDPKEGCVLGYAQVTEVRFIENRRREITVEREIEGVRSEESSGPEQSTAFYIVKRRGAVVRNCAFRSQMKTAMVFRDPGICEHNLIEDCAFGVHGFNSALWGEGPHPYAFTIRGNAFNRIRFGAVTLLAQSLNPEMAPLGERIRIEDNVFRQNDGDAIHLTNLRDVVLRGNRIVMEPDTSHRYASLALVHCADIEMDGLTVRDPRVMEEGTIRASSTSPKEVIIRKLNLGVPEARLPDGWAVEAPD